MHHGDVSLEIAQGLLVLKKRIGAAKISASKLDSPETSEVFEDFGSLM